MMFSRPSIRVGAGIKEGSENEVTNNNYYAGYVMPL